MRSRPGERGGERRGEGRGGRAFALYLIHSSTQRGAFPFPWAYLTDRPVNFNMYIACVDCWAQPLAVYVYVYICFNALLLLF